jgi:hypothetical protein
MNAKSSVLVLVAMVLLPVAALAAPQSAADAARLGLAWCRLHQRPLGEALGQQVKEVQTYRDANDEPLYHVVYLQPSGFLIVPADDLVEPVVAFVSKGRFDPSTNNPLGALVSADVPVRVRHIRSLTATTLSSHSVKAQGKWRQIQDGGIAYSNNPAPANGMSSVSDLRIGPLLQTSWNQDTAGGNGLACFNYYTPPYGPGSPSNYVCGCVATAFAQVLRYFEYPAVGVGTNVVYTNNVDGTLIGLRLRGGDGAGGPYDWGDMPGAVWRPSVTQCQAIGALTYDAAVSIGSSFGPGGSGANGAGPQFALTNSFMYANAVCVGASNWTLFYPGLVAVANANLDARLPLIAVLNGHEVACDGYGYYLGTLYHHMNMGWGGEDNAWYNLPTIDATLTNLCGFVCNIFTHGTGEIISGRVTAGGLPVPNAGVTAVRIQGGTYAATTDTNGIYALVGIPSSSEYRLTVTGVVGNVVLSASNSVATGLSICGASDSGDVWAADFDLAEGSIAPVISVQPENQAFVDLGANAGFTVSAVGPPPFGYQWQFDGTNLPGATASSLTITNVQLANNGDYSVVVTNAYGATTSAAAILWIASPATIGQSPDNWPGFIARSVQIEYQEVTDQGENWETIMDSVASMEAALSPAVMDSTDAAGFPSAGLLVDPLTDQYFVNLANLTGADGRGFFPVPGYINMDIQGPSGQGGMFTSPDGVSGWPKSFFPGIPGYSDIWPGTTYFAVAFTAYVYLQAGSTEFGVFSDDGFCLTISSGANPNDAFERVTVGQWDGPRNDGGETDMQVYVPTNGVYALRLDYEQGVNSAECELFTVVNGVKILVNDTNNPACLLAYPTPEVYANPYAVGVSPAVGQSDAPRQITVVLQDGVPNSVNTNSIVLKLNGVLVSPAISQTPSVVPNAQPLGSLTTVSYAWPADPDGAPGVTAELLFADMKGNVSDHFWSFTNATFLNVANANSAINLWPANSGFVVYPWQTEAGDPDNVAIWVEEQILGLHGPNLAVLTGWPNSQNQQLESALPGPQGSYFVYTNYINWDTWGTEDTYIGLFTSPDGVTGFPKQEFPGIINGSYPDESGFTSPDGFFFSMLVETWLDFPSAGNWQMGIAGANWANVRSGRAPGDIFGQPLGDFLFSPKSFSTFSFLVPQPGLYPFRMLYYGNGGPACCEWFTVTPTGQYVLINDASQGTNAVYAYVAGANSPIYVSGVIPVDGATNIGPDLNITAFVVDGNPAQVASVQMWINAVPAPVAVSRNNHVTTATIASANCAPLLLPGSNVITISYADNASPPHVYTNSWQFSTIPFFVPSQSGPAVAPPSGMLAWWPGESDADDVAGTNDGTLYKGVTFVPGVVRQAFAFDGVAAKVAFGNQIGNFGTNDFTVEFWIKTLYTNWAWTVVLGKRDYSIPAGGSSFWNLVNSSGYLYVEWDQDSSNDNYVDFPAGNTFISDGRFHHIAVCRHAEQALAYVDGSLGSSTSTSGITCISNNADCVAGAGCAPGQPNIAVAPWPGVLDEIRIYNRALTGPEIQSIFEAGTNGMCAIVPLQFSGPLRYSRSSGFVLSAALRSGQNYRVQASADLDSTNWITLTNFVAGSVPLSCFTNRPATNALQQFYRLVTP